MVASAPKTQKHYAENPAAFPLDGGCACGLVRYRLERTPLLVHCCHCTVCQRESGSAFALNALIEADAVTGLPSAKPRAPSYPERPDEFPECRPLLSPAGTSPTDQEGTGEAETLPKLQALSLSSAAITEVVDPILTMLPSQSSYGQEVARCPACGTMVWSSYAGSGRLLRYVRVGTLDKGWMVGPDVYIFTRSKRDFVTIPQDKPAFSEFYPNRQDVYRKEALERFELLLPKINEYRQSRGFSRIKPSIEA